MYFTNAQWIWCQDSRFKVNEYADFKATFIHGKGPASIRICAKSNYLLYVNEKVVGFGQFSDFPEEKVFDEYDLSSFVIEGENTLSVIALSRNYDTFSEIANGKGIIFEIIENGVVVLSSGPNVLSRLDPNYVSGPLFNITPQLGMGYSYDFTGEGCEYLSSQVVEGGKNFVPRPVARLKISSPVIFREVKPLIYDGGKERAGYLYFEIDSPTEGEKLAISFGEHLVDGCVRKIISNRTFELDFTLKKGINTYTGPFFRLGLRYLQIENKNVIVKKIGIREATYPLAPFHYETNPISKEVAEVSAYTLSCCVHEHYEDCPWREQAQYTMDTRTEILLGYHAFKETRMPRSAISQMSFRLTDKDVLPITSPSNDNLSIVTYSLIYPLLLVEYYHETKDLSLLEECFANTKKMMDHYLNRLVDGLLAMEPEWNFFEWSEGLSNERELVGREGNSKRFPFLNNAFMAVGLKALIEVCQLLKKDSSSYSSALVSIKRKSHDVFFDKEKRLYAAYWENGKQSIFAELSQIMAVYSDIAYSEERKFILDTITSRNDLVPVALSNYIFKYEILLADGHYDQKVIDEVNSLWGSMLKKGSTTYWETVNGAADFGGAGSLCHGWSAVPLYAYFHFAGKNGNDKKARKEG